MKKRQQVSLSLVSTIAIGIVASIVCLLLTIMILPVFLLNEYISEQLIGPACAIAVALSCFIGSMIASKLSDNRTVIVSIVVSAGTFMLLLCAGILLVDNEFSGVTAILLAAVIGGLLTVVLDYLSKRSREKRRRGRRYS